MQITDMPQPAAKAGAWTKFLLNIASVDEETLRLCGEQDWNNARAVGQIMLCTWLYQAALFYLIGERLFGTPGEIRPELILAAMFLATFILLIDSYMVMRSGWHLSGIEELKRGGLDISGGPGARIKAGLFLVIRIVLSIGIAQLTAIFVSLLVFGADINSHAEGIYRQANAGLIAGATALVDNDIQRTVKAVDAETVRYDALSGQATALRQNQIDPSANDPQVRQTQQELTELLARQAKADEDARKAETFASNELGGIRGDFGNSGRAGNGPKHRAAVEAVANARRYAQETARALDAARTRLDGLRSQFASTNDATKQKARDQAPEFENAVAVETNRLAALKDQLARLTQGRDAAIRDAVDNAPGHVALDNGLLAQIKALEIITQNDNKITAVVLLIDLTSFGFELAAVLAKITSYVPTTYAALLARDAYLNAVRIVDDMIATLDGDATDTDDAESLHADAIATPHHPAPRAGGPDAAEPFAPFGGMDDFVRPARRPRGRPRKVRTLVTASSGPEA